MYRQHICAVKRILRGRIIRVSGGGRIVHSAKLHYCWHTTSSAIKAEYSTSVVGNATVVGRTEHSVA